MKTPQTMAEALAILQLIKELRVNVRNELNALRGYGRVGAMGDRAHTDIQSVLKEAQDHALAIRSDREVIALLDDSTHYRALADLALSVGLYRTDKIPPTASE